MNNTSEGSQLIISNVAPGTTFVSPVSRPGLVFPVARLHRLLRQRSPEYKIAASATVYVAAVLEYVAAEVLELAGSNALATNQTRITPRNLQIAIKEDEELDSLIKILISNKGQE